MTAFSLFKIPSQKKSVTRLDLTLRDIRAIVSYTFGGSRTVVKFDESANVDFGSLYFLTFVDNSKAVIRLAPRSDVRILNQERDTVARDCHVINLIKESTDVPVPTIIRHDVSCEIIEAPYAIMEHIPGITYDLVRHTFSKTVQRNIDKTLGRYVRSINEITGTHFGLAPRTAKKYCTWREAFLAILESVLRDAEDLTVLLPYDLIRQNVCRLAYTLDDVRIPRLVPYDAGDNHMVVNENGEVQAIFNFERSIWGDPLMECAFRKPKEAFLEGYGKDLLVGKRSVARRLLYTCHYYLMEITAGYYRQELRNEMKNRRGLIQTLQELTKWVEN